MSLAREAGGLLRERFVSADRGAVSAKSTPTDVVTESDVAAERLIRDRLAAERPDDAIVGEEGADTAGSSGRRWVVDPLDGTVNFLYGIPHWAVSVAVQDGDGGLAGVVFDPMREELWTGERGGVAALNGSPIRVREPEDLGQALIGTGFGYDSAVRARQGERFAALIAEVRDVRRAGAAALDLAWVAGGRLDGFFERGVKAWDVAAGALICELAGAEVHDLEADPPAETGLLAAAPAIAAPLLALVR